MDYSLYNGNSEGFSFVVDGYLEYAAEILTRRSMPSLYDGLKPVSRRILYAINSFTKRSEGFRKSGTLVGRALDLHPHGDASIYQTMVSMTDSNGSLNVPLLEGQGFFGKVYSAGKAAAMRYTKAKLSEYSEDYFRDMDVCEFMPSEEGEGEEPVLLPVRYPISLVNGTTGLAVGVASLIPSFNFNDVINLTIKGIQKGFENLDHTDIIVPDLPTGGVIVRNDEELAKIMKTGRGKLNVRAKVATEGKKILVQEVPFGKTVDGILKSIKASDISNITEAHISTGFGSNSLLTITCKTKKVVDQVLIELYRKKILQSTLSSNMLLIGEDDTPRIIGVYDVIKEWYEWRSRLCVKKFQKALEKIDKDIETYDYFKRLIDDKASKDEYINIMTHKPKREATAYLKKIFPDIPDDVCTWIGDRSLSVFYDGGRYYKRSIVLAETKEIYKSYIADISSYIIQDLQDLLSVRGSKFPRKTEISYNDYRFNVIRIEEKEDDSFCFYYLYKSGFLKKNRDELDDKDILCKIPAKANSILIGFDNFSRLLRVIGSEIEYTAWNQSGTYLPKYFGVVDTGSNTEAIKKYQILYLCELDGSTKYLLYKDGYIGVFDTSEFLNKKRIKVVTDGVDTRVYDLLLDIVDEQDLKDYIVFADDHNSVKFGIVPVRNIKHKSRKTRTKVLQARRRDVINCNHFANMSTTDVFRLMPDPNECMGNFRTCSNITGDVSVFIEGKYFTENSGQQFLEGVVEEEES